MKFFKKIHLPDNAVPFVIALVAVVIVGIIAAFIYKKRDIVEAQRTAKIIEINGPCSIMREGATINAVADMPLYSGDTFYSGIDASARIMIDDDKFLYLDSTTRINFTASGTPEETHTLIFVESGSMLTEVKEKLADGESFDIVTPNTFMEIHGTDVLTVVAADEKGNIDTTSAVLQGNVSLTTVLNLNGKIVSVKDALSSGGSRRVTTNEQNLVGNNNMKSIAWTGQDVNGETPASVTSNEAGLVYGDAVYSEAFLDNVIEVLEKSDREDIASGRAAGESNGNSIINANALRRKGENNSVANAEAPTGLLVEGDVSVVTPDEAAALAEAEEAARIAAQEEANRIAEERAAQQAADEQRTQDILAIEAAQAEVAALNEAIAEAQRLAEEEAARQAAEQAQNNQGSGGSTQNSSPTQNNSDVHTSDDPGHSSDTPDVPETDDHGGTFTGYYTTDGIPLYINSDEIYYYTDGDEIFEYDGDLLDAPPSDPSSDPPSDP